MLPFLLVIHAIIAVALVAVILMQRSEGGGLTGSNSSGMLSARGAADFLTRATTILATLFVGMAIALAAYGSISRAPRTMDTSLSGAVGSVGDIPLGDQALPAQPAPATPEAAAEPVSNGAVPLAE